MSQNLLRMVVYIINDVEMIIPSSRKLLLGLELFS